MYVENKVALITGGANGLGFQYAKQFLKNGLKAVTLVDVDPKRGNEAVEILTKEYGANKVMFIKGDVVNKTEFESAMKKTVEAFGNFDILVNNAGIMDDTIWEKEIDVNLKGVMNGCLLAFEDYLPKYKTANSEPVIINIASVAALNPNYFGPIYCATKSAVISLSKSFALEENYRSKKVRILTVCPGATATTLLDDIYKRSYTPRHSAELKLGNVLERLNEPLQTVEVMAEAMVKIIEKGENGSLWVVREGRISQVDVPNEPDMKIIRYLD